MEHAYLPPGRLLVKSIQVFDIHLNISQWWIFKPRVTIFKSSIEVATLQGLVCGKLGPKGKGADRYSELGETGSRLLQAMFQQFLTGLLQMLGGLVLAALGDGDEQSID